MHNFGLGDSAARPEGSDDEAQAPQPPLLLLAQPELSPTLAAAGSEQDSARYSQRQNAGGEGLSVFQRT